MDDDAWADRVGRLLASYGVQTTHAPPEDPSADDHSVEWPVTPERLRDAAAEEGQTSGLPSLTTEDEANMYPSCFYAQMLCALPHTHRSVSAPTTPRASVAGGGVRHGKDLADDEQRFASRVMKHTRELRYGNAHRGANGYGPHDVLPAPLVDCCDGSVLAQAEAANRELHEMLAWAQGRNRRARELRAQLESSRLARYVADVGPQVQPTVESNKGLNYKA